MAYKNVDRKLAPKGLGKLAWLVLLAGLWLPTYWVAYRFNFHPELTSMVKAFPLYLPGQVIYWSMDYGQYYPRIFIPAIIMLVVFFLGFIALMRQSRKGE